MRIFLTRMFVAALACAALVLPASGQQVPLQIDQKALLVNPAYSRGLNWQSYRGVPISNTAGNGSDGRYNIGAGPSVRPVTPLQFQSFAPISGVPAQGSRNLNETLNFSRNANNLNWPRSTADGTPNGPVTLVLRSAAVGAAYFGQQVSFQFGAVIPPPSTDENGQPLPAGANLTYWFAQPYSANNFEGAPFYWSPHAQQVFAIQAGTIEVTWQKVTPSATRPADYDADPSRYVENAGFYYRLYKANYLVSGSAVKTPQKMYWTEGVFQDFGHPVEVPAARVSAVNVVYNNAFPARVDTPYVDPGSIPINDQGLQEHRTLWYDNTRKQILAYNVEGRVFVEFLGELNGDGATRRFLGFEIVDVFKQASPSDVTVELGERVRAYADGRDDAHLRPAPILQNPGQGFYYEHAIAGNERVTLYATRETQNLNDFQAHWLIAGVAGLEWPYLFVRYTEVWPSESAKYTHYIRRPAATDDDALLTAVQLPAQNAPVINFQDALDRPRARLTTTFKFYTRLDENFPAHRTLLRYSSGDQVAFERVLSWLESGVKDHSLLAGSVATTLREWEPANSRFNFANEFAAPRVVTQTVNVGARIAPPAEPGAPADYLAGHIIESAGNSFHPGAYADPFQAGFTLANRGAIIPVNAIPGRNSMEIWWFRANAADEAAGFIRARWPAVIGRYTLQWPSGGPEIVLASNDGSGGLPSLQATGSIYHQNEPDLPGYNPNEEHALMIAGQAYALRDDLNITSAAGYSSDPFVLLQYRAEDDRPAMVAFRVLREKAEAGETFDYIVEAGSILQAPMPLPLLEAPVEDGVNYNTEPIGGPGDLPGGWSPAAAFGPFALYEQFTFMDRNNSFWVYRGLHAGLPALEAGRFDANNNTFNALPAAAAVVNQPFAYYVHTSRRYASLAMSSSPNLPAGLSIETTPQGLAIRGTPTATSSATYTLTIRDTGDGQTVTRPLAIQVLASGTVSAQQSLAITSRNPYSGLDVTYRDRPPAFATAPRDNNSFVMRFYYKTLEGFAWPGLASPPDAGSIVPYLRPVDDLGDPIGDPADKETESLPIVYRPTWPSLRNGQPLPTIEAAETLTVPTRGLTGVRGQRSVEVLYQQSIAADLAQANPSVVLFDPTVRKFAPLSAVPSAIATDSYQGRVYFPALPPHLADRIYYDPATTRLVLEGRFVDNVTTRYLLLNRLSPEDVDRVIELCPDSDSAKADWTDAVGNLQTQLLTFGPDPDIPGSYVVKPDLTETRAASQLVEITHSDQPVDSYAMSAVGPGFGYVTYITGNQRNPQHASEPVSIHIARVAPPLHTGQLVALAAANPLSELTTIRHTADLAGNTDTYEYDWRISPPVDGLPPVTSPATWPVLASGASRPLHTLGGAGVQSLGDNYVALRFRSIDPDAPAAVRDWSAWTPPVLIEGWIKRVLAGINPFNQRTRDLFNNPVNTTASIIAQAGGRWEGDVALNAENLNNLGLIEIYETVLNRGRDLSVNAGINYGPANDALLLAAGYLNDLYMMIGNDAFADAANPTIGIGTSNDTFGNIATALFAFKGQRASLIDEELALLRGRDDVLAPGVTTRPAYNRLFWNYTRGIDAGEVIYALNYNILDQNNDGVVDAFDASKLFPQGHGDAYGHYLTALKNYYDLLMNQNFDWVPRIEAVTILGAAVSVDYQDERKFAAAAAALARTGRQIFDLAWRQNYRPGAGWAHFSETRANQQRPYDAAGQTAVVTRHWGLDHWASRVGQGAYLNWIVANAILPAIDPDPSHEGIQKVDRTTVPEIAELPQTAAELQAELDNANGGMTPLNVTQNSIPFDINPLLVTGTTPMTHFEQVYDRAVAALNNALVAFNEAQDVNELMRAEESSLANLRAAIVSQELAYNNDLIEIYGAPYPDDMGPGKTWPQDYTGPDLIHYMYVENPDTNYFNGILADPATEQTFSIDMQLLPDDWLTNMYRNFDFIVAQSSPDYSLNTNYVEFTVGANGFFGKPADWTTRRLSPGSIQQAISELIAARDSLRQELYTANYDKYLLDKAINAFRAQTASAAANLSLENRNLDIGYAINSLETGYAILNRRLETAMQVADFVKEAMLQDLPDSSIFGTAFGGDTMFPVRIAIMAVYSVARLGLLTADTVAFNVTQNEILAEQARIVDLTKQIATNNFDMDLKAGALALADQLLTLQGHAQNINQMLRSLDDAQRAYDAEVARGNRIQQERLTYRQRAAALVQGYRTRDAAFRIFQNEKLERYKTLFDLAARYAFLAANAYDYETGLLNTPRGRAFLDRIISARALGVVENGQPQYAGSNTGDPGLSSALAEMKADWDVLKGRLGFNNPDGYGTIVSMRGENFRILPGAPGDNNWRDVLNNARVSNLLADADVKRYCQQIDDGSGAPVPGIVLTFNTLIADGLNLFGKPLGPGDHNFSPSSFATKIFAVGVAFEGYIGMDNPSANGGAINGSGAYTPGDPTLDPFALAATPYVYLIPVGTDSMRSPPISGQSEIRAWNVDDLAVPLPFDISGAEFANNPMFTAASSLSEPLFNLRRHQAFRPVSDSGLFNPSIYGAGGQFEPSQYTNRRLIGRSVWNSKWKLVIPGKTLLADPNQGLDRFIDSVKDAKLYFVTYSYAGN